MGLSGRALHDGADSMKNGVRLDKVGRRLDRLQAKKWEKGAENRPYIGSKRVKIPIFRG